MDVPMIAMLFWLNNCQYKFTIISVVSAEYILAIVLP